MLTSTPIREPTLTRGRTKFATNQTPPAVVLADLKENENHRCHLATATSHMAPGATMSVVSPATGQEIASLTVDTLSSLNTKYNNAVTAHKHWRDVEMPERIAVIAQFKNLLCQTPEAQ